VKLCLVSAFADTVKDWPYMRNLPKLFLRSFENVDPVGSCLGSRLPRGSFFCMSHLGSASKMAWRHHC